MEFGLVLEILKISMKIFDNERRDRFLKQYIKLEREYQDELNKIDSFQSDLALDRMYDEAQRLARLVIAESKLTK